MARDELLPHIASYGLQPTLLNVSTPNTVPPVYTVAAVGSFVEGQAQLTVATDEPAYSKYVVELGLNPNRPSPDQVGPLLSALGAHIWSNSSSCLGLPQ